MADLAISDGVIHHTSDPCRAFGENCRVLKSGGLMYLAIYKPGRYEYLYKYPRSCHPLGTQAKVHKTFGELVRVHSLLFDSSCEVWRKEVPQRCAESLL